jgi:exodeoxyribonuclease V beta subunit
LVHQVLDDLDFCAPNVKEELRARIETRWGDKEQSETIDKLTAGLIKSLESPLGPLLNDLTLKEIARKDYLAELNFELRLGDGKSIATDCDLGGLCLDHLAPDDPLRPWAEKLALGIFKVSLEGHLTGSIDAVFRVSTDGGPERFVISDYKTNGLNKPGQPMTAQDYHPDLLALEMAKHHYPLQALLYSVALHRYLNGRLANYDPEVNLGGAAYLFVRGMEGPETPKENGQPNGVFSWKIPSALVVAASNLLAGHLSAVGGGK